MPPDKHSKWSPSSAHSWMKCPSRIRLTENLKEEGLIPEEQKASRYAKEGSKAHKMLEIALASMLVPPDKDEDMRMAIAICVEEIVKIVSIENMHELHIEEKVDIYKEGKVDVFGTCDIWWLDKKKKALHLWDLKFGMGDKVYAKENPQLMLYAIGILGKSLDCFGSDMAKTINLHILQPRLKHIDSWQPHPPRLFVIKEAMQDAITMSFDLEHFSPGKKTCHYCPAKGFCPAHKDWSMKNFKIYKNPERIADEERVALYRNKKKVIEFLDSVEDGLLASLLQGQKIDGVELTEKRTHRRYTKEALDVLERHLGPDAYTVVKKPINFSQAEKLGVSPELMNQITIKPQGDPALKLST